MRKSRKTAGIWILLIGLFLTIPLIGTCQIPYSESKRDSIQLTILRQISDPKVKRVVLRVLEDYPNVKTERDSCEKLLGYHKTAGRLMSEQIVQMEVRQKRTQQDLEKTVAHRDRLKQKLRWWRSTAVGVGLTLAIIILLK